MNQISRFLLLAVVLTTATILGCGDGRPQRVPVSGQVLIDGEPLTHGFVRFVPENDRPSRSDIGPDGRFTLGCYDLDDGAVTGTHRVAVIANKPADEFTMQWLAPQRYADYQTSGLEFVIDGPTDDLTINLTSGPDERP